MQKVLIFTVASRYNCARVSRAVIGKNYRQ